MKSVKAPERERERVLPFGRKPKQKRLATKEEKEHLKNLEWFTKFVGRCTAATFVLIVFILIGVAVSNVKAADPSTDAAIFVNVPLACTLSGTNQTYNLGNMTPGTLKSNIGNTKVGIYCNDDTGYKVYAMGYSSQDNNFNTDMISTVGNEYNIKTGTATSGNTSAWAMKVTAGSGTTPPTILNDFSSFKEIPSTYTPVAGRDGKTDIGDASGSYITLNYQLYLQGNQAVSSYTGKVRYALVHNYNYGDKATLANALKTAGAPTKEKDGKTYYTIQGLGALGDTICSDSTIIEGEPSQIQLIDTRDDKLYWVTKLQDGKCWMTQNLDLDLSTSTALTSENTNLITYGSKGYDSSNGYSCSNSNTDCSGGTISWTPERSTIPDGSLSSTTWTNDASNPYSYDDGERYRDDTVTQQLYGSHGLSGNYYNWTAAIASNNSSSFTSSTISATQNSPKNSVCPSGWKLPTITNYTQYRTGTNDFYNLDYYYNGGATNTAAGLMNPPLNFTRSGFVNGGSLSSSGGYGYYWSSTVYSSSNAYRLYFNSGLVNPTASNRRVDGFAVRCVVEN